MSDDPVASVTPIHRPIRRVRIHPTDRTAFVDSMQVSLSCATDGVDLHYTLDGSDPTPDSPRYEDPIELTETTVLRARALREGVTEMPATQDGTHVSARSLARFEKQAPLSPADPSGAIERGVGYEYYESDWKDLYASFQGVEPVETGTTPGVFDRPGADTDATFGFRYEGLLEVPETGVYSVHAPRELVHHDIESGYVLRVALGRDDDGRRNWYPSTREHAFGTWSVALDAGHHPVRIDFVDYREGAHEIMNSPDLDQKWVWDGETPDLRMSGPSLEAAPIPEEWLWRGE